MSVRKRRHPMRQCECKVCLEHPYSQVARQHQAINRVLATFDEKSRRRFVGLLALQRGRGGVQWVHEVTGLSRMTIRTGREEIRRADRLPGVRRTGGGRKAFEKSDPPSWPR